MARFQTDDIMTLTGSAPRYDLGESTGPDLALHDILGTDDIPLRYGSAAGDERLRRAIAERNGVDPDEVVVTAGGAHALFLIAFVLCKPTDEAVVTAPLFPLARSTLEAVGAQIRTVKLSFGQSYKLKPGEICAALSGQTKLVSLASPQNPSGVAIPPDAINEILDAMRTRCPQAFLLVDETFREATYGKDPMARSAVGLDDRIVSVASLSKCHGAPGLRIGWAITRDGALREQFVLGKFSTILSCSAVDEALALRVLQQNPDARRAHLAAGLAKTAAWIQQRENFVEWVRPDAGVICCIRLRPDVYDDAATDRFHSHLAIQGVRLAIGTWFNDDPGVFRLGFGMLSMQDLETALDGVSTALEKALSA